MLYVHAKLLLGILCLFDLKWISRAMYDDPQINKTRFTY